MEGRVLILAPRGRDAGIAANLLQRHGYKVLVCDNLGGLVSELGHGVGAVVVTEEALATEDVAPLTDWITGQPTWSDLPFIVLANGGSAPRTLLALKRLERLGNVV